MATPSEKLAHVKKCVGVYPDFPKPGIVFRDIFPVLSDCSAFSDLNDLLLQKIKDSCPDVECIIGLDARGFIFGPILALALKVPFVPIRKKGKLPGECHNVKYELEYGTDQFEMQKASIQTGKKVVIVDDLLATGGTMQAACTLVEKSGAIVSLCLVVIELADLKGREKFKPRLESLLTYTD